MIKEMYVWYWTETVMLRIKVWEFEAKEAYWIKPKDDISKT